MEVQLNLDLRKWAADHDMTLTELGRRAGLSHTFMRLLAEGETRPGTKAIAGLLTATGLPYPVLFKNVETAA